jgi:hypothetical protein
MATVYLYRYREYVHLVQADRNVPNINLPMIIYDTKVYKGVTNTIDFVIRNNDRKPISLVGYTLIAQIREVDNISRASTPPEILLEKNLIPIDETAGKYKLILDPMDIESWDTGYYQFNIRTIGLDGVNELLYTDINKSTWSNFELIEGISSSLMPPLTIDARQFTPSPIGEEGEVFVTGALPGDAQSQKASGTHTIAVYADTWLGKVWVEGSLTNQPPLPSEWFKIKIYPGQDYLQIDPSEGNVVKLINFTMNLYWLRVVYQPDRMNRGKFLKILYKN